MRIGAVLLLLATLMQPAQAGSAWVSGKVGFLSEWELSAEVNENATTGRKDFSGPLTIKHVGLCAVGRTVEMSGENPLPHHRLDKAADAGDVGDRGRQVRFRRRVVGDL